MKKRILLPGGAGLVGQQLVVRLKEKGYQEIVVIDKHPANLAILSQTHPEIIAVEADLAEPGAWQDHFKGADTVVMLQAQIGGNNYSDFERNNIESTCLILETMKAHQVPQLVHISSSVVESVADDFYTRSKKAQEKMVLESGLDCPILRPTLMFGWFDRKHLGWLSRFMNKVPVFPIPGKGDFMRQPLYAGDFCRVIIRCIEDPSIKGIFNISGHEKIDYVDIIREIKQVTGSRSLLVHIPYPVFYALLWTWGIFDKNPPFTTQQLSALVADDEFEVIDWPTKFGVPYTPFKQALDETFNHPIYSKIVLEF
jgi:nucleoside-diphosphate-sugar epimerase